jgi:predicted  nucleic acid-binding Zn-ribbon protein
MQRAIWFITFFIIIAIGYFYFVVDDSNNKRMSALADSDVELTGNVNSTVEVYDRLEKKWIGTSKHVQTLQNETHLHYKAYAEQMDSIDIVFEEIKFSIDQLEETLTRKIDRVKDNVRNLEDSFEGYKRSTNRTVREIKQNISTIQDDIKKLNDKVFPPVEEGKKKKK